MANIYVPIGTLQQQMSSIKVKKTTGQRHGIIEWSANKMTVQQVSRGCDKPDRISSCFIRIKEIQYRNALNKLDW